MCYCFLLAYYTINHFSSIKFSCVFSCIYSRFVPFFVCLVISRGRCLCKLMADVVNDVMNACNITKGIGEGCFLIALDVYYPFSSNQFVECCKTDFAFCLNYVQFILFNIPISIEVLFLMIFSFCCILISINILVIY